MLIPSTRPRARLAPLAAALAAALALPAAAEATMVVYADGGNVWEASPDGAVKRQLTTDGGAGGGYVHPSAADDGTVVAIKTSSQTTTRWIWVKPPGTAAPVVNVMPQRTGSYPNIGPFAARVKPSGTLLAYTYSVNHGPYSGYPDGGFDHRFAIVTPTAPGSPTQPAIDQPAGSFGFMPRWVGDRLIGSRGGAIVYEQQPLQFAQWLTDDATTLDGAEANRAVTRVLLLRGDDRLALIGYSGPIAGGTVTSECLLPATGVSSFALSPDGSQAAWSDGAGLHVATVAAVNGGTCPLSGKVTLSGGGSQPAFSPASVTVPDPGRREPDPDPGRRDPGTGDPGTRDPGTGDPGTGDPGTRDPGSGDPGTRDPGTGGPGTRDPGGGDPGTRGPGTGSPNGKGGTAAKLAIALPRAATAAKLRAGVRAVVTAPAAGRLTATLTTRVRGGGRSSRVIALGTTSRAARAGKVTITLKARGSAARRLRKGAVVTVALTLRPARGATLRRTATIAVR